MKKYMNFNNKIFYDTDFILGVYRLKNPNGIYGTNPENIKATSELVYNVIEDFNSEIMYTDDIGDIDVDKYITDKIQDYGLENKSNKENIIMIGFLLIFNKQLPVVQYFKEVLDYVKIYNHVMYSS